VGKQNDELIGTAVIVVDMINAYLRKGEPQYCAECWSIVENVRVLLEHFRSHGGAVVFCNTQLKSSHDPMARKWGMHAVIGTDSCKVIDELGPVRNDVVCGKRSYNGFFQTNLNSILQRRKITGVVVCGIHTHACVLLTAAAALDYGFEVVVLEDCMTTSFRGNHSSRLRFFGSHIGTVSTLADFLKHSS
jgi:nicotinamidase/pyrazinamidase